MDTLIQKLKIQVRCIRPRLGEAQRRLRALIRTSGGLTFLLWLGLSVAAVVYGYSMVASATRVYEERRYPYPRVQFAFSGIWVATPLDAVVTISIQSCHQPAKVNIDVLAVAPFTPPKGSFPARARVAVMMTNDFFGGGHTLDGRATSPKGIGVRHRLGKR